MRALFVSFVLENNKKIIVLNVFLICLFLINTYNIPNAHRLSLDLGDGNCKWTPPVYEPNNTATYFKTLITGYPGGAKRLVYVQMEGLVALTSNDEWPDILKKPNRPFLKSNYPHHEGRWTWGDQMDQVVLVMRDPRKAIREYHDVLHDINYANDAKTAYEFIHKLYMVRAPVGYYLEWRDDRTLAEIHWYGWVIDFWMENGLLRDISSHNLTTQEHFKRQEQPDKYTESGRAFEVMVGNATIEPQYSKHCTADMRNACEPVAVISVDRLIDPERGSMEAAKIGAILDGNQGLDVVSIEARGCIWEEITLRNKGVRTMIDRSGKENEYGFTQEMLEAMVVELNRLINKYSSSLWDGNIVAQDLVEILNEYVIDVSAELSDLT